MRRQASLQTPHSARYAAAYYSPAVKGTSRRRGWRHALAWANDQLFGSCRNLVDLSSIQFKGFRHEPAAWSLTECDVLARQRRAGAA